jgi:hypothetical protein
MEKLVPKQEALPQRLKPPSKQCIYRSAEALRHPKAKPEPKPKAKSKGKSKGERQKAKGKSKNLAGRFHGIPPLRKKRARMGQPSAPIGQQRQDQLRPAGRE